MFGYVNIPDAADGQKRKTKVVNIEYGNEKNAENEFITLHCEVFYCNNDEERSIKNMPGIESYKRPLKIDHTTYVDANGDYVESPADPNFFKTEYNFAKYIYQNAPANYPALLAGGLLRAAAAGRLD